MFECSSLRLLEWQEHRAVIGNISSFLRGLSTSRECKWFPKSYFFFSLSLSFCSDPFPFIMLFFDKIQQSSDVLIIRWRHVMKKSVSVQSSFFFLFFFTEGTQESQKMWSTAIRQLGSPSPASGRPCPPFPGKAGPRWLPPRGSHLCPPRRQRWPVSHSTSNSPGHRK